MGKVGLLRTVLSRAGLAAWVFLSCFLPAFSQTEHRLEEVVVSGRRDIKDLGLQKTAIDSTALKENISLSMADVLTFNSSVFVKQAGKATLSTVSFRGTSPSHTRVTWNGLDINSPMLGMTDFSMIPSYFIDRATLLHGSSSLSETDGGLGGLIKLSTIPDIPEGFSMQYVQGIGSFSTFDEFLKLGYAKRGWTVSTRASYSTSPNDYPYINHDKKENIYDADHNITGQYHPKERNRSGAYKDLQVLQEVNYNSGSRDLLGLNAWYVASDRELPMLTTDYGDEREFENRQREQTIRAVAEWNHNHDGLWQTKVNAGYVHTWLAYDYKREIAEDIWAVMTRSRSRVNTFLASGDINWHPMTSWMFKAGVKATQHLVKSKDDDIIKQDGDKAVVGYDKGRLELGVSLEAKWQPIDRFGLTAVVREELYGTKLSPLIPALFAEAWITGDGRLTAKASVSSNYRFPTLNDLYFLPGGNPDLKSEHGVSYDLGLNFKLAKSGLLTFEGGATWFDSYINDWIIWLPTTKGFFSPRNVKRVHAYGVELDATLGLDFGKDWRLDLHATYSWTPSINKGEKISAADKSVGKQLPYVPRHSMAVTGRLTWKSWSLLYKWCHYSKRYTMSSNETAVSGQLPAYFMNNVSIERKLSFSFADFSLQLAVNNLFNEDYLSILSRPMPGINFEFFLSITPKFF